MKRNQMKPAAFLPLIISYACITMSATESSKYVFRKEVIEVKPGTDECVSACMHESTGTTRSVSCPIVDCDFLPMGRRLMSALDTVFEEVYFEKYTDEMVGENKLALYFKWSSTNNVTTLPDNPKRYMVNITDGVASYSICYHVTKSIEQPNMFYNDCFGKVKGTLVRPGSVITVNMKTLPVLEDDDTFESVVATIEVPDCTNGELHTLKACSTSGGLPTSQSCMTNCDTFSLIDNTTYPISCTISKDSFDNSEEICDEVNKTTSGTPSIPKHIPQEQEWYKFIDSETGEVRIALNFSWIPGLDSSVADLHGYFIQISPESQSSTVNFDECFSVHTVLSEEEHKNAHFFYDCYGRTSNSIVDPGQTYRVNIQSLPSNREALEFSISIPTCADSSTHDVTYCINDNNKTLRGEVEQIFCDDRSMKYSYLVSPEYGSSAVVIFCERGLGAVHCKLPLLEYRNLAPAGTLYNISLPSSANLSINYSIFVHGNDLPQFRDIDYPDFSQCVKTENNTLIISLISVLIVLILLGLSLLLYCFCKKGKQQRPVYTVDLPTQPIPLDNLPAIPHDRRVYVIFADDHTMHKDVVHWFCTFLKHDLGLDVRLNIWEEAVVAVNPLQYMTMNLKKADKVIIICSEGTKECLEETNKNGRMFTPVLREICMRALHAENPTKFLVAHFDYSAQEHIPELLYDHCQMYSSIFKLMKQFEEFYFRLVGIEQYQNGGILRIDKIAFDRFHDPTLTKSGEKLKESIDKMSAYVKQHPTWYSDHHGDDAAGSNFPLEPSARPVQPPQEEQSIVDLIEEEPSIRRLYASPPPVIQNNHNKGARPKTKKVTSFSPQPATQNSVPPKHDPTPQQQSTVSTPVVKKQPCEHPSPAEPEKTEIKITVPSVQREPCEHQDSDVVESNESSYMVSDWESEDQSTTSPSRLLAPKQPVINYPDTLHHPPHYNMNNISFKHAVFGQSDFPKSDFPNSHMMSYLPSNQTEISDLGMMDLPRIVLQDVVSNNAMDAVPNEENTSHLHSPKSVRFTLANVDEDLGDIEDQIKSINLSDFLK